MAIAEEARAIGIPDKPRISSFSIQRFNPQRDLDWLNLPLTKEKLAEIEIKTYRRFTQAESRLFRDFRDPKSSIILLGSPRGFLIGYAYATGETMYNAVLREVAIDPNVKESGAVEKMMTELEKDLIRKAFTSMEGNFPVQNGYADRIAKIYSDRILEARDEGFARFLSIDLGKAKKSNVIPFPSTT